MMGFGCLAARADDNVVQEFSGSGSTTTALFKVKDRWEVRWNARQVVSVAVMSADGTIVAGAAGVLRGSLFVPLGGQYYLKINDGTVAPPSPPGLDTPPPAATNAAPSASANTPPSSVTNAAPSAMTNTRPSSVTNAAPNAITNAPPSSVTNAAPSATTNAPPVAVTNAAPASTPDGTLIAPTNAAPAAATNAAPAAATNTAPAAVTNAPPIATTNAAPASMTNAASAMTNAPAAAPPPSMVDTPAAAPPDTPIAWHLQVVEMGTSVASDQALTVYTPFFIVPDTAVTPVAVPPPLPPPVLTDEQAHTVVTIKGDEGQGTGFFARSTDGTFVVTHLHLLAANPNVQLFTSAGAPITIVSLKGALDRDVALFAIKDDNYSYLPMPADAKGIEAGDQLIIPDIGAETTILLGKPGRIIGMSPEQIDFDNDMGPDSSGAPVIHVKSGTALAIVTSEKQVDVSDNLAKAWPANPAPGSAGIIPYFGLRLGGVQGWEAYDPARFLEETVFLKKFHQDTRCLDSYLNGRHHRPHSGDDTDGPPDNRYYVNNDKLRAAQDAYRQLAAGADREQRIEAAKELLFDLQNIADTGFATLQEMNNLYAFDQNWAQEEMAYRKALKSEIENLGDNIGQLDDIARER